MNTTTRIARITLVALVSALALSATACDQPTNDETLRFAPEEVVELMADNGFEDEANELVDEFQQNDYALIRASYAEVEK